MSPGPRDRADRVDPAPSRRRRRPRPTVGWREWVGLPDLGVEAIKAKVDTGAATSSLHAWDIEEVGTDAEGRPTLRFGVHPAQRDARTEVVATAALTGWRKVRSSNGQVEERPVITTTLALGDALVPIDITLTRRDAMGFRMLLGRSALRRRVLVDPGRSFLTGRPGAAPGPAGRVERP